MSILEALLIDFEENKKVFVINKSTFQSLNGRKSSIVKQDSKALHS